MIGPGIAVKLSREIWLDEAFQWDCLEKSDWTSHCSETVWRNYFKILPKRDLKTWTGLIWVVTFFRDVMSCNLVDKYKHFGRTFYPSIQTRYTPQSNTLWRNITHTSHISRLQFSKSDLRFRFMWLRITSGGLMGVVMIFGIIWEAGSFFTIWTC